MRCIFLSPCPDFGSLCYNDEKTVVFLSRHAPEISGHDSPDELGSRCRGCSGLWQHGAASLGRVTSSSSKPEGV